MELNMWAVCIVYEGADIVIRATFENLMEAEKYWRREMIRQDDSRISIEVRSIALREYDLEDQEIPF